MTTAPIVAAILSGTDRYISPANTAKLVRFALKNAFPGQKFSVRTSTYAGGASIYVTWTDGPTRADVDAVIKRFSGSSFDGMQDLQYSKDHWLLPNGTVTLAAVHHNLDPQKFAKPDPAAVRVSFGADYVSGERRLSKALRLKAAAIALEHYALGPDVPAGLAPEALVDDDGWAREYADKHTGSRWVSDVLYLAASRLRGDGTVTHDANGHDLLQELQTEH